MSADSMGQESSSKQPGRSRAAAKVVRNVAVLIALVAVPWVVDVYTLHLLVLSGIAIILALSLNLMMGYVGELSLGHAAFYGIGGYTSALLSMHAGWPVWLGMLASGPVAASAAAAIAPIVLRLRGPYFIIATLSFSIILQLIITNWVSLTNGPMGLLGVPYPVIGGFELSGKIAYFYLVAVCVLIALAAMRRLINSRTGRAFESIRENEFVAASIGISHFRYSLLAFSVGAAFAGFAGALYVHYVGVLTPDLLGFDVMVTMLVMVAVGGKGTLAGPIVGALLVTFVPEELRFIKELRLAAFGLGLMVSVILVPNGLISLWPGYGRRVVDPKEGN